jgi:hypothetical protein
MFEEVSPMPRVNLWCNEPECHNFAQTKDPDTPDKLLLKCQMHAEREGRGGQPVKPPPPPPPPTSIAAPAAPRPGKRKGGQKPKAIRRLSDGVIFEGGVSGVAKLHGQKPQTLYNAIFNRSMFMGSKWEYVQKEAKLAESLTPAPAPPSRPLTTDEEIARMEGEGATGVYLPVPAPPGEPIDLGKFPATHAPAQGLALDDWPTGTFVRSQDALTPVNIVVAGGITDAFRRTATRNAFYLHARHVANQVKNVASHAYESAAITHRKWINDTRELLTQAEYALDQYDANQ